MTAILILITGTGSVRIEESWSLIVWEDSFPRIRFTNQSDERNIQHRLPGFKYCAITFTFIYHIHMIV